MSRRGRYGWNATDPTASVARDEKMTVSPGFPFAIFTFSTRLDGLASSHQAE